MKQQSFKFRMPAEWEPQQRLWFSWPTRKHLWAGKLEQVQREILRVVSFISQSYEVGINGSGLFEESFQTRLDEVADLKRENLFLSDISNDDAWCRDHGPTFVQESSSQKWYGIDWNFNAWGGKFEPREDDHLLARRLLEWLETDRISCPFIGEGGGIEVNGKGSVMLTKSVWLNSNRNAELTIKECESWLGTHLGCNHFHWFENGLAEDDTDGHIDMFARFIGESAIILCREDRPRHPQYHALQQIGEEIEGFKTATRGHYDIIDLPMPDPVIEKNEVYPASYGNFLIFNDMIWVPQYGQEKADAYAMGILRECFPSHQVFGMNCLHLIQEGGAIHCLTQQQPNLGQISNENSQIRSVQPIDLLI